MDSRLFVVRGKPIEVLPRLFRDWGVTRLVRSPPPADSSPAHSVTARVAQTFETDTEPYAKERDAAVCRLARDAGVAVSTHATHTLYDPERLLAAARDRCPSSYGAFTKVK